VKRLGLVVQVRRWLPVERLCKRLDTPGHRLDFIARQSPGDYPQIAANLRQRTSRQLRAKSGNSVGYGSLVIGVGSSRKTRIDAEFSYPRLQVNFGDWNPIAIHDASSLSINRPERAFMVMEGALSPNRAR
jgi:hypothetical protein